ncbi:pyridoxine 5'-phosphate synthase [Aestuariispira insulae]|uniref:Pyridoxine 5'-phosphate synthase n=1 Tax=Aestuariispira insulae TaxID=1461337 RepID=A0A3D9HHR1_9PROT|nr:pyridoxine 5'-phosphate synthase [Aestuariispira insulae]RED48506.1 pyridoxine 5'-phosphate synthase [Aestuariispira insulae]
MTTKLSVNLNKVALLRNQRHVGYPDPVAAGRTILEAGAHGLTVHPRPDERHIRRQDVYDLATMLDKDGHKARGIEYNLEGNPFDDFLTLCRETRPDQATLVPDAPDAATSDNGWDVMDDAVRERLRPLISELKSFGCRVSLFMNPDAAAMARVAELGADRIELYTGPYADAFEAGNADGQLALYAAAASAAVEAGLGINAGHDLTTDNLPSFKAAVPDLAEVSIGHAFIADALWMGFGRTVEAYLEALDVRRDGFLYSANG